MNKQTNSISLIQTDMGKEGRCLKSLTGESNTVIRSGSCTCIFILTPMTGKILVSNRTS